MSKGSKHKYNKEQWLRDKLRREGKKKWRKFKRDYPQVAAEQAERWRHFKSI